MHAGYFIVPLVVIVPVGVYSILVVLLTRAAASWSVALLRPPLAMLLLSPAIIAGHGIAVVPAGVAFWQDFVVSRSASGLAFNGGVYAVLTLLAIAFEAWLTVRRRRIAHRLRSNARDPDSASALRQLTGER